MHKVMMGSGMGLICSGELNDTNFVQRRELRIALDDDWRKAHSAKGYLRVRDDSLCHVSNPMAVEQLMEPFSECARPYRIKNKINNVSDIFLDLQVRIVRSCIPVEQALENNNVGCVLSHTSANPARVHANWPVARF